MSGGIIRGQDTDLINVDFPAPRNPVIMVSGTVPLGAFEAAVSAEGSVSRRVLEQNGIWLIPANVFGVTNYVRNFVVVHCDALDDLRIERGCSGLCSVT